MGGALWRVALLLIVSVILYQSYCIIEIDCCQTCLCTMPWRVRIRWSASFFYFARQNQKVPLVFSLGEFKLQTQDFVFLDERVVVLFKQAVLHLEVFD